MNKILFFFIFIFSPLMSLASDSFDVLYLDLVNYWRLGRRHSVLLNDPSYVYVTPPYFTGNKLDFYNGYAGCFLLYDEINGNYYLTRNGKFSSDLRGFLVNEDGYYVLNTDYQYINLLDIDLEARKFNEVFLLVVPADDTPRITEKYIIASQYRPVTDVWVFNEFLETMFVSLNTLLEKAIPEIDDNRDFENKDALINILYKRYFEILESERMIAADYHGPDYYAKLLEKIELFERELRKH